MMKKYIDTNIFLYPLLYEDEKAKVCKSILLKIGKKEIIGITSFLTWDEVVYSLKKLLGRDIAIKEGRKFLKIPELVFVRTDENIIYKSQELIEKYNINPRDAIHAATCILTSANELLTDDSDFDKIKEIKRASI